MAPSQSPRDSLQVTTIMTDLSEVRLAIEPCEARNEVMGSNPEDLSSRQHSSRVMFKPEHPKSLSCSLRLDTVAACTHTRRFRSRVKSLTPTEVVHQLSPEARPRKLSAPQLGTAESRQKESQIHISPSNFPLPDPHQVVRRFVSGQNLHCGERCCSCHRGHEDNETSLALDEFWMLQKDSRQERERSPTFIVQRKKHIRLSCETYLTFDEPFGGNRYRNKTQRRHSSSSARITDRTPACRRSRRSLRQEKQPAGCHQPSVAMSRRMSTCEKPLWNGAVTVGGRKRVSAGPESDNVYEETQYYTFEASDKSRRLIVSVFTAFVIMLVALAILMISATLSIGVGGIGSA